MGRPHRSNRLLSFFRSCSYLIFYQQCSHFANVTLSNYLVLAYLSGKGLIEIHPIDKVDQYNLTENGNTLASRLKELGEFNNIVARSRLVGEMFGQRTGTWIKKFIYRNFPEVVRTP